MPLRLPLLPLIAFVALLAGCAGLAPGGTDGPAAAAPTFRVGDRWVYAVRDGFRAPDTWQEVHEVAAVGPDGIVVRVSARGDGIDVDRTERWPDPGVVASGAVYRFETRRFVPPLVRYRYPLAPGARWTQRLQDPEAPPGPYGPLERYTRVGGYQRVATPAGTFEALRLRVIMRLDDETFWRWPTEANHLVWYAPALGIAVREERNAEYLEKGDAHGGVAAVRTQHAVRELLSFKRGR